MSGTCRVGLCVIETEAPRYSALRSYFEIALIVAIKTLDLPTQLT